MTNHDLDELRGDSWLDAVFCCAITGLFWMAVLLTFLGGGRA